MIKDTNEVFKFLVFLLNLVVNTDYKRPCVPTVLDMVSTFVAAIGQLDQEKMLFVLKHFFLKTVFEKVEKAAEVNQYFVIRMVLSFAALSDRLKAEILHMVLAMPRSKETVLKFFEVWTDEERSGGGERALEGTLVVKAMLKETKLTTSVGQRIFFFKVLANLIDHDYSFVERVFFYYEDLFFERHSEQLKAVAMFFLTAMYNAGLRKESLLLSQEKNAFSKDAKTQTDVGNKHKQVVSKLPLFLRKMEQLLEFAGPLPTRVFFLHIAHLIDSSVKLMETYVRSLLRHPQKDIACYLEEGQGPAEEELRTSNEDFVDSLHNGWVKPQFLADDLRFGWILVHNPRFDSAVFERNSPSIISFLLKMVSFDDPRVNEGTFWYILHHCFYNCKFEALNFEYFDFIMNAAFVLLNARIKAGFCSSHVEQVLTAILRFEIKREVTIKNFESLFEDLAGHESFKFALVDILNSLFAEIEENDVYSGSFKSRFGTLLNMK
jgi:hypothetical protein